MGPMCSIVYENEPAEKTACKITKTRQYFLIAKRIRISIVQGIGIYRNFLCVPMDRTKWSNEQLTRTMVFTTLVFSNVILSLVNRSFYYSVFASKQHDGDCQFANLYFSSPNCIHKSDCPFL
jgi:Ca2+-transporting ATPase